MPVLPKVSALKAIGQHNDDQRIPRVINWTIPRDSSRSARRWFNKRGDAARGRSRAKPASKRLPLPFPLHLFPFLSASPS